ncbi:hypothetical protein V8E52_001966 [Russula decolorans]
MSHSPALPPQITNNTNNNGNTHSSTSPAQLAHILSTVLADNETLSKDLVVASAFSDKEVEEEENEDVVEQVVDRDGDDAQSEDAEQASDLEDQHRGEIPGVLVIKSDTTKDLLTVFSDLVTVNFKKGNKTTNLKGRWCLICRANKQVIKGNEKKAFFTGGNSSC